MQKAIEEKILKSIDRKILSPPKGKHTPNQRSLDHSKTVMEGGKASPVKKVPTISISKLAQATAGM
jgi:hypothetical protein